MMGVKSSFLVIDQKLLRSKYTCIQAQNIIKAVQLFNDGYKRKKSAY